MAVCVVCTCAIGLSRVGGEADAVQVGEVRVQVVFPCQHQRGRTQVCFVQDQHYLFLELARDVVIQGRGEL